MKSFKFLFLFLFLLNSSNSFSYTHNAEGIDFIESSGDSSTQMDEALSDSFESYLSDSPQLEKIQYFFYRSNDYRFFSFHCEKLATEYLNLSRLIGPGLTSLEIIYPFHSFL